MAKPNEMNGWDDWDEPQVTSLAAATAKLNLHVKSPEELLQEQLVKYGTVLDTTRNLTIDFQPVPGFFKEILVPGDKLIVKRYTPNPTDPTLFNLMTSQGTVSAVDRKADIITIDFATRSGVKSLKYNYKNLIKSIENELPETTPVDSPIIKRTLRILEINAHDAPKAAAAAATPRKTTVIDSLPIGASIKVARYVPASRDSTDVKLVRSNGKLIAKNDDGFTAEFALPNKTTRPFTYKYKAIVDNSVELPEISTNKSDQFNKVQILGTSGGNEMVDPYYLKYLKYKAKYLKLKESL